MPTTGNHKQRVLNHLFSGLKKRYGAPEPEPRPILEQLIYAICREGTTRDKADQAFRALRERFFDWNEIRVSSAREIEEVLHELPHADSRAQRLISLLQEVFETTFSFDLESLHKKGLKQAAKQLGRYEATNDHSVAWVIQQSLGGHAIPLDDAALRVVRRLGLKLPSVHLETYTPPEPRFAADDLVRQMDAVQHVVSLARAAREEAGIRVRQPLPEILAVPPRGADVAELGRWEAVIQDEINVKRVRWQTGSIGGRTARPNFRTLGRKCGKAMNEVAGLIRAAHERAGTDRKSVV